VIETYKIKIRFEEPVTIISEAEDSILRIMRSDVVKWEKGGYSVLYGNPIIPASSLKGALRSFFLALAKTLYDCDVLKYHDEASGDQIPSHSPRAWVDKYAGNVERIRSYIKEDAELSEKEAWERLASISCPVCLLFGSQHLAGALRFSDVVLERAKIRRLSRTAMNRALGKVSEGALFTIEVAEGADGEGYAVLAFTPQLQKLVKAVGIECAGRDPISVAKELWDIGTEILHEDGIELGHSKSAGLGRAVLEFQKL